MMAKTGCAVPRPPEPDTNPEEAVARAGPKKCSAPPEANKKDHEREVKWLHAKIGELTMIADPARRLAMNAAE